MLAQSSKARGETSDQALPNGNSVERSRRESTAEDEIGCDFAICLGRDYAHRAIVLSLDCNNCFVTSDEFLSVSCTATVVAIAGCGDGNVCLETWQSYNEQSSQSILSVRFITEPGIFPRRRSSSMCAP